MTTLSYSTINNCLQPTNSHNWLNKQMGIKVPDNEYFKAGREIHKVIQGHLSGKKPVETLSHIEYVFPIVEEVEFDPRCKRFTPIDDKYQLFTLVDGHDPDKKRLLEIKTSKNHPMTLGEYMGSMQRKLYALGWPEYNEAVLVTGYTDTNRWRMERPKRFPIELTQKDRDEALVFIKKAIEVIEKGDFTGGLTDGKCLDPWCNYKENCQFK